MQAESCYHLAQGYHAGWNYEEAFRYYYQTTHLVLEKFVLPLFDLEYLQLERCSKFLTSHILYAEQAHQVEPAYANSILI
ncbi:unnamed protein product, partial [Rotaria sp. Silwood1]